MEPRISVVIPTYNEEDNISACLESLSKQTIPREEYELIVVDGGSADKTREFAEKYADRVFIQKSKGLAVQEMTVQRLQRPKYLQQPMQTA